MLLLENAKLPRQGYDLEIIKKYSKLILITALTREQFILLSGAVVLSETILFPVA